MSMVPSNKVQKLAYKSMNPKIYLGATLFLYVVEIYLSILIDDLGNIFGFIGTIAGTSLPYFIPSVLFYKAYHLYGSDIYKEKNKWYLTIAKVNFVVGILLFFIFLYSNIISLTVISTENILTKENT